MIDLLTGYFKSTIQKLGFVVEFTDTLSNSSGYFKCRVKIPLRIVSNDPIPNRNVAFFRIEMGSVHACCGSVQLHSMSCPLSEVYDDQTIPALKALLRTILSENNNIVSYLTNDVDISQIYYASILQKVGFEKVFEARNRNSGNNCITWMADLTKLNLY